MQIDMPAHSALCSIFGGFYGYGEVWGRKWLGSCLSASESYVWMLMGVAWKTELSYVKRFELNG